MRKPFAPAANRSSDLINDILDFSKIEARKLDLELLDFDLQNLLDDLTATMALRAQAKGLELLCAVDPQVPTHLRGDAGRLRQILTNLVGNAVKFTHTGEVVIRVSVDAEADDTAMLRFSVRDTGIGIRRDKIGRALHEVHAGRRLDHPPVWRHGTGPGHLETTGRTDGRRGRRRQRRGTRLRVLVYGATG